MSTPVNFRDVGKSINARTGSTLLKTGLLFRSARPDASHLDTLYIDHGIRTILDLRTDTERLAHDARTGYQGTISFRVVDFNYRPYTTALLKQLTYWQTLQFLGYYGLGYRREAISILGENVLAPRGLVGLAQDSITFCTNEVKAVFDQLTTADGLPCLYHCTQGKDRTGLVTLLILLLLEVPIEAIKGDYLQSQLELAQEREDRLIEIRSIGLPDSFADCDDDWVNATQSYINEKFGGIKLYLRHCQVTDEQQDRMICLLRA